MAYVNRLTFKEEFSMVGAKTKVWAVLNVEGTVLLGKVSFRPQWRRYVFLPNAQTLFDSSCLQEIHGFLDIETAKWRNKQVAKRIKPSIRT